MLKADVKKGLDSLISASVARNIRDTKRPSLVRIVKLGLKTTVECEAIVIGHGQTNRDCHTTQPLSMTLYVIH